MRSQCGHSRLWGSDASHQRETANAVPRVVGPLFKHLPPLLERRFVFSQRVPLGRPLPGASQPQGRKRAGGPGGGGAPGAGRAGGLGPGPPASSPGSAPGRPEGGTCASTPTGRPPPVLSTPAWRAEAANAGGGAVEPAGKPRPALRPGSRGPARPESTLPAGPGAPGPPGGRRPRRRWSYLDAVHDVHLLRLAQRHGRHAARPPLASSARARPAPRRPRPPALCVISPRGGRPCRRHRQCRELHGLLLCAAGCVAESGEPRRLVPGSHRCGPRRGPRSGAAGGGDGGCGGSLTRGLGLGSCVRLHGQLGGGTGVGWKSWGEAGGAGRGRAVGGAARAAPSWG